jgi:hypothetical protein
LISFCEDEGDGQLIPAMVKDIKEVQIFLIRILKKLLKPE